MSKKIPSKTSNPLQKRSGIISENPSDLKKLKTILGILIAAFAFLLYAQSIPYNYTLDDHPAIDQNKVTKQGVAGIPTLLTTDYWYGYEGEIRGPVYRPTSLILFAIVWQFSPDSPHIYHFLNVLLYALSCWILFHVLCRVFEKQNFVFPFVCSLLYATHPIHTEVVNNIKSMDEILCFLFGITAIFFILKYLKTPSILNLIFAGITFFLCLISKETGITFLIMIPLLLYVFSTTSFKNIGIISLGLITISGIYFLVRMQVLSHVRMNVSDSVLNNTLLAAPDFISREATAFYILLRYLLLMIFPHPLRCDYNYSQITILSFTSPLAIIAILLNIGILGYSILMIKRKNQVAFGILFFMITIAPVSNIFLLIGATMAERFLYMPSLGFCIIFTFFLIKFTKTEFVKSKFNSLPQFFSFNSKLFIPLFVIIGIYSLKTFSRNADWKDNYTIFKTDVEVSENSATAHYFYGSELLFTSYKNEKNAQQKGIYLDKAIEEFTKATTIFNTYHNAFYCLGKAYNYKRDYQNALKNYEKARDLFVVPNPLFLNDLGELYLQFGTYDKALLLLDSAIKLKPDFAEANDNKGVALMKMGKFKEAIPSLERAIKINPDLDKSYFNLGCSYYNLKDYPKAVEAFKKALTFDADNYQFNGLLGLTYASMGDSINAKIYTDKSNSLRN